MVIFSRKLGNVSSFEAEEWNKRYQNTGHNLSKPRSFLKENISQCPQRGWALDVAMGEGHNANLLAKQGMKVLGVDFSRVALVKAKKQFPSLYLALVNLPALHLADECLDIILNFWFLDRNLFSFYRWWLKPGGLLMFETMRFDPDSDQSHLRPEYLLQPGELRKEFSSWEFLVYDENVKAMAKGKPQLAVRMLVRKPMKE